MSFFANLKDIQLKGRNSLKEIHIPMLGKSIYVAPETLKDLSHYSDPDADTLEMVVKRIVIRAKKACGNPLFKEAEYAESIRKFHWLPSKEIFRISSAIDDFDKEEMDFDEMAGNSESAEPSETSAQ